MANPDFLPGTLDVSTIQHEDGHTDVLITMTDSSGTTEMVVDPQVAAEIADDINACAEEAEAENQ